ncbi:uncharacterized protein LOC118745310 [Rhagoletis pomonella]|uniref:uncharacterized protein LOC118745310 n=1 Tax=Rhagoletis pomonella TaxID=28610 RepID=UPI00177AC9EB|nr:uncharacterized protein LOC118745310 [Rhagoletis pomonella]
MLSQISYAILVLCFCASVYADISHFLAGDYDYYSQQYQYPVALVPQQSAVPSLYGAPPPAPGDFPSNATIPDTPPTSTHSPVAPVQPSTTEFTLPEIVENRSAKSGRFNFIPLRNQYLTPEENRPNYEASKRPPTSGAGYFYPRPTSTFIPITRPTITTTTERPHPIVVLDPPAILPSAQAPINSEPIALQPPVQGSGQGYDYNVPAGPPFQLPLSTPAPAYLPADNNTIESGALRLHVHEMRCMQHAGGGYFRAVLKVDSFIGAAPTVDNDSNDKRCELKLARSFVVADIVEEDFEKCGVHTCGKDLCLRWRFPSIRGMRTSADGILTLHCKTQQRVAVKTHALKMSVFNEVQARSLGTYAHGGTQLPFRTHVELLRRTAQGYERQLDATSAVLLGEELLLRAHVIAGDGWNYTKLTDVNVERVSPSGELLNNVALITPRGCINPSMQSICTQPPSFDPPLGHRLNFKAVMFQGMHSGDELVISMRITGCMEARDCHVDASDCGAVGNLWRRKRNVSAHMAGVDNQQSTANGSEVSEISRIAFRVVMPKEGVAELKARSGTGAGAGMELEEQAATVATSLWESANDNMLVQLSALKLISAVGFVLLLTCLGIFAAVKLTK